VGAQEEAAGLTVEHGLYLLLLVVAFGLRFLNLGAAPLMPLEAAQSWGAWLAATGTAVSGAPAPVSALFYGLQSLLFFVAGGSDVLARLLGALAGTALVLLPWWWRSWLGRGGALVVALLLAIDPWLTTLARTADGVGLTLFLGLLTLTALWWWRAADAGSPVQPAPAASLVWERNLAVALGLLLVSGPQAWSWVPVLAAFAWIYRRYAMPHRTTWLWFGLALLLGASGLLARPEGIGAVGTSLTTWLGQWSGDFAAGAAPYQLAVAWPFQRLLLDQLLLAVFGVLGLLLLASGRGLPVVGTQAGADPSLVDPAADDLRSAGRRSARQLALFLGVWLVWGIVLALLPGRSPFVLPMLGLPLAIAAGTAIAYLVALPMGDVTGLEVGILLGVAAVLIIAGVVWLAMVVESLTYDTRLVVTALLLVALVALVWIIFGFWAGWRTAGKLAGLFFAGILLLVSVRSGWMLNHLGGQMAPNGFFPVVTLPEARLLPLDMQRISSLRNDDPFEAPVQVVTAGQPPDPLVGWLLRDMRQLTWVTAPDPQPPPDPNNPLPLAPGATALVVAPYGMEQDRGLEGLLGARYPLTMRWDPAQLPSLPEPAGTSDGLPAEELAQLRADQAWSQATRPQLEWLLYRTVRNTPAVDGVTLWAAP
jgi:hypothetical protein